MTKNMAGWLVPIFALAHEHDPDPEMRPYKEQSALRNARN